MYGCIIYLIVTIKGDRFHWIEIHEEEWCPSFLRQMAQKCLQMGWQFYGLGEYVGSPADSIASVIVEQLKTFNCDSIFDLCSGSCGPSSYLNQAINKKFQEISDDTSDGNNNYNYKPIITIFSDLYPHCSNWKRLCEKSKTLTYCKESVDATNVPLDKINSILQKHKLKNNETSNSIRIRTLFASFHHFHKNEAISILKNTIENGDIFIMAEIAIDRKSIIDFIEWPIILLLLTPVHWCHLIYDYLQENESNWAWIIVKIVAMFLLTPVWYFIFSHDFIISCSRAYLKQELIQLTQEAMKQAKANANTNANGNGNRNVQRYKWDAKRMNSNMVFPLNVIMPCTILIGVPNEMDVPNNVTKKKQ